MMSPALAYSLGLQNIGHEFFLRHIRFEWQEGKFGRHGHRLVVARLFQQGNKPVNFRDGIFVGISRGDAFFQMALTRMVGRLGNAIEKSALSAEGNNI